MTLTNHQPAYKKHILFIALTFLYILPMLGGLYTWGDDGLFHMSRALGLENVFTSPVNFTTFHSQGTMMNIFYPWLTLYPMYLFYKITGSIVLAYQLFYSFLTILTLYICDYVGRSVQEDQFAAIVFAVVYTFSGYRATDIFERSSMGEVLAMTFLPLVLLGCYHIFTSNYKKWYILTIGMTLIVYSHVLSVFMAAIVIFFYLLVSVWKWDHKKERLLSLTYATLLTIGLSLFYFLPFIEQNMNGKFRIPESIPLSGIKPHIMLENILDNNLAGHTIGLMVAILVCILVYNRRKLSKMNRSFLYAGLTLLVVISAIFPWELFRQTPLQSIQFEWRFTAFVTLFISLAFSSLSKQLNSKKKLDALMALLLCALTLHTTSVISLHYQKEDAPTIYNKEELKEEALHCFNQDYANIDAIKYKKNIQNTTFLLDDQVINVSYSISPSTYIVRLPKSYSGDLVIPIYFYKGQTVTVDGKARESHLSKYGSASVLIKDGDKEIIVSYKYTKLTSLSLVASLLALIFLIGVMIREKKGMHKRVAKVLSDVS